jgi:hypothetical protein
MPAQQRNVRKNYIGTVSDEIEEQRIIDALAKSGRRVKDFILGVMAAMLRRQSRTRS